MLRVFDPMIPIAMADISEITFALRDRLVKSHIEPDTLVLSNGSIFAAAVV